MDGMQECCLDNMSMVRSCKICKRNPIKFIYEYFHNRNNSQNAPSPKLNENCVMLMIITKNIHGKVISVFAHYI